MAKGTTFGTIHSGIDLRLIQQRVVITPPKPRTNIIDVPGANGGKDLTEALGIGVTYKDCSIVWTFALYPGSDWTQKRNEVSNALNGLSCHIVFDDDPDWYYDGRLSVTEYPTDGLLRQITIEAICRPYKRKIVMSRESANLTTDEKTLALAIGNMPIVPEITVDVQTTLHWGSVTLTISPGTHTFPALRMKGDQRITVTGSAEGRITITWREGSLV